MDRRAVAIELKESYYNQSVKNCEQAMEEDIIENATDL